MPENGPLFEHNLAKNTNMTQTKRKMLCRFQILYYCKCENASKKVVVASNFATFVVFPFLCEFFFA
jgi:hypothetical protein